MIHPENKAQTILIPPNAGTCHPLFLWILFRHLSFHLLTKSSFPLNTHPSISQRDKWDWEPNIHIQFLSFTEGCSQQTANFKKMQWHLSLWAPMSQLDEATESEMMNSKSLIFSDCPLMNLLKRCLTHKWKWCHYLFIHTLYIIVILSPHSINDNGYEYLFFIL